TACRFAPVAAEATTAATDERLGADMVPLGQSRGSGTEAGDRAAYFKARDGGKDDVAPICAVALDDVAVRNAARLHLDQHFTLTGHRDRQLLEREDVRRPGAVKNRGQHGSRHLGG